MRVAAFTQVHIFEGLNTWTRERHIFSYTGALQVRMEAGRGLSVYAKEPETCGNWRGLRLEIPQVLMMDELATVVHGVSIDDGPRTVILTRPGTGWDGNPPKDGGP